ncbi:MAG TPA: tRNA (N6-threonylcarbamoyladenosine(37)-N6)-methyltransferase TrmO [Thermomicrobiales bacterium]|nr:tRNA (N6-threonylcarbamoyladenosine(37)-N6)-methyltransferase TrmO [Thermomicrobiales bacterium]
MQIELTSIGVVRTEAREIPRHWSVSDVEGTLVFDEQYTEGLRDIAPGDRIVVIFAFDRSPAFTPDLLVQRSGADGRERGVFSLCSPVRPNPIGLSIVDVLEVAGSRLTVRGIDMLDGTPILDIKPYVGAE